MVEIEAKVLNEILTELKSLNSLREEIKNLEKKIDLLTLTKKDVEIFNLIDELDKKGEFLEEEDLIKSGFKI
jgi:hypothetical protein